MNTGYKREPVIGKVFSYQLVSLPEVTRHHHHHSSPLPVKKQEHSMASGSLLSVRSHSSHLRGHCGWWARRGIPDPGLLPPSISSQDTVLKTVRTYGISHAPARQRVPKGHQASQTENRFAGKAGTKAFL